MMPNSQLYITNADAALDTKSLSWLLHLLLAAQGAIKVSIEKSRGGRFSSNRIWAGWHYWRKIFGPIMSKLLGRFFQVLKGKKISVRTRRLLILKKETFSLKEIEKYVIFFFFTGKETFSIVSCSSRNTSPRDFSIMTLGALLDCSP